MRWPFMLKSTHERERADLIEKNEKETTHKLRKELSNLRDYVVGKWLDFEKSIKATIAVRNGVMEITAGNAHAWDDLLKQLCCPDCGSPHGEFQIVIPVSGDGNVGIKGARLRRRCLACKKRTWLIRAGLLLQNPRPKPTARRAKP